MAAMYTTTASGQRVICGTPDEVHVGTVKVDIGSPNFPKLVPVEVLSIGRTFHKFGRTLVYGYLTAATPAAPSASSGQAVRRPVRRQPTRPYRGGYGNTSTRGCEACQDVEDAGDARGRAAHRGNPRN
jgi:hypothetical protein